MQDLRLQLFKLRNQKKMLDVRCSKILREAGKQEIFVPKILDLKSSSEQIFSKIDVGCP